jgi:hypothetical protein
VPDVAAQRLGWVWHDDDVPARSRRFRKLAVALLLLLIVPMAVGCVRVRASITVSPDDRVSGQIVATITSAHRRSSPT